MDLSIVAALYHSEPYLENFYRRVRAAAEAITADFEIILVNDGSPDRTLEIALSLFRQDERVRVIDLSRNFGQHRAMMTGLAHARGNLVFLIDSDLEEDPELLAQFRDRLKETGADVVYGVQTRRKGGLWERISGAIFYKLFIALSSAPIPRNLTTVRLMTRRYVQALVQHKDREIFLAGLWHITGFEQISFPVSKASKGSSSYTFRRKVTVAVNAMTSFSSAPLVFIFYLGVFILIVSWLAALYLVIQKLFFGTFLFGWPSLIVSIWMIGGLTIFSIGIIGIYLSKIFIETKDRPYTVIREIYQNESQGGPLDAQRIRRERSSIL